MIVVTLETNTIKKKEDVLSYLHCCNMPSTHHIYAVLISIDYAILERSCIERTFTFYIIS